MLHVKESCSNGATTGARCHDVAEGATTFDLVRPMSTAELLTLLAPSGDEWVLRPRTSSGDADDTSINDRVYDSSDMIVTLYLGGESSKRPRIGVTATTKCIRIGETGPGTFPTPIPTSIPKPAPKP